jgi:hypothetical protein
MQFSGLLTHVPVEPYGTPLQPLGYSALLSLLPVNQWDTAAIRTCAAVVQGVAYVAAVVWASRQFRRNGSTIDRAIRIGGLIAFPVPILCTEILSDSLFISLIVVLVGVFALIGSRRAAGVCPSRSMWALLGLVLGMLILLRSASSMVIAAVGVVLVVWVILSIRGRTGNVRSLLSGIVVCVAVVAICALPQVVWIHQQYGIVGLYHLPDSHTQGISAMALEDQERALHVQMAGCFSNATQCVTAYEFGPLGGSSDAASGTAIPSSWKKWLAADPPRAMTQAGLILLAVFDQDLRYVYVDDVQAETAPFQPILAFLLFGFGLVGVVKSLRCRRSRQRAMSAFPAAFIGISCALFLFVFHAENRYGAPMIAVAAMFSLLGVQRLLRDGIRGWVAFSAIVLLAIAGAIIARISLVEPLLRANGV